MDSYNTAFDRLKKLKKMKMSMEWTLKSLQAELDKWTAKEEESRMACEDMQTSDDLESRRANH